MRSFVTDDSASFVLSYHGALGPLRMLQKFDISPVPWHKNFLWGLGGGVYNKDIWVLRFSTASGGRRP